MFTKALFTDADGNAHSRCNGEVHDTVLDWEAALPEPDLRFAERHARRATLSLVLGSSLQIQPAGKLPLLALRQPGGRLVTVNLQATALEKHASLCIHARVDEVMRAVCAQLGVIVDGTNEDATLFPIYVARSRHTARGERMPWTVVPLEGVRMASQERKNKVETTKRKLPVKEEK